MKTSWKAGGYIEDKNGAWQFFATPDNTDTVILLVRATIHNVDDVDLDQILDFYSGERRVAPNLYTNFKLA